MFYETTPIVKRMIAYGLMIHGTVRLLAGLFPYLDGLASASYFIEAFYVKNEEKWKTVVPYKATFVSVFSILLGVMVLSRILS